MKAMVPYVQLSTNCRISFWYNVNKICTVIKLSSTQLVDNCTYGTIAFLCIKSSLKQPIKQHCKEIFKQREVMVLLVQLSTAEIDVASIKFFHISKQASSECQNKSAKKT